MKTNSVWDLVGNTPLVRINSLSEETGCHIWAKLEFYNPGGSIKDRTAKAIIIDAEEKGLLKKDDTIVEGSAGNTGIGLALLGVSRGYQVVVYMPNNQAKEKSTVLRALGANVIEVPPCPFANNNHFYHQARIHSENNQNCYWANQFENLANFRTHYSTTGKEIWEDLNGKIDIFISAAGTGGTIAGVSNFLKDQDLKTKVVLVDPMGSGLFQYFKNKVLKSEGSSITEGIGIMRITANYAKAKIDEAIQVDDSKMIDMLYHIAKADGLLIGTSGALNLAAAYQIGLENKNSQKNIVTVIPDSALRYQTKVFNEEFLAKLNLKPKGML